MPFRLSEPVPHPGYVSTGRGGAGNIRNSTTGTGSGDVSTYLQRTSSSSTTSVGAAASSTCSQRQSQDSSSANQKPGNTFASSKEPMARTGRGGTGNMFPVSQWTLFSFDEELEQLARQSAAPIFHIGRGGVGNQMRKEEDSSSSDGWDDDLEPRTATGWGGRVEKSWNDWICRR